VARFNERNHASSFQSLRIIDASKVIPQSYSLLKGVESRCFPLCNFLKDWQVMFGIIAIRLGAPP
jgi:hypothetical protein